MKNLNRFFLFLTLTLYFFSYTSCTSQRQIEQEKALRETQEVSARTTVSLTSVEEQQKSQSGKIEELEHQLKNHARTLEETNKAKSQELTALKEEFSKLEKNFLTLSQENKEQKKFITQTLQTLKELKAQKKSPSARGDFSTGMNLYKRKKYAQAKPYLQRVLTQKNVASKNKEHTLHNLGIIFYVEKNYDTALTYFSKLITQNEKSPYATNSLLHVGKILSLRGNKAGARASYQKLLKNYPKSRFVPEAKRLLNKL